MKDGLVSFDTKATTASGTTVVAGTFSGGDVIVANDSISKAEVGNEIPFTQISGTQQIIQYGADVLSSGEADIVFPTAFGAAPTGVWVTNLTNGSINVVDVSELKAGSFHASGTNGVADGSFMWLAIGNTA